MDFITYVLIIPGLRLMPCCKIYPIRKISEFVRLIPKKESRYLSDNDFLSF